MDINAANLSALTTAFSTAFNTRLIDTDTSYGMVSMTVPSSTAMNTYPKLSLPPSMREWLGDRVINRFSIDGFTVKNQRFENTIAISVDELNDDQVGIYAPVAADFGQTAAELPDDLVWGQLEKGFTELHYDGQYFFDTDHPVEDENGNEVSRSNFQGGSGDAWYLIDRSRAIKPIIFQDREAASITPKTAMTDDNVVMQDEFIWAAKRRCAAAFGAWEMAFASKEPLTPASFKDLKAQMKAFRGHRGRKYSLGRDLLLVVNAANEGAARELLLADRKDAGASNVWKGAAALHVEGRLS